MHLVEDLAGEIWKPVNYLNKNQMSNYKRVAEVSAEGFRIRLLPTDDGLVKINKKDIIVEYLYQNVFKKEIKEKEKQRKEEEDRLKNLQSRPFPEEPKNQTQEDIFNKIREGIVKEPDSIEQKGEENKPKEKITIALTEEQKAQIDKLWDESPLDDPPSVMDLTKKIFGPDFDGRSPEALAIRRHLSEKGLKPKVWTDIHAERKSITLTEAQKEFIANNCSTNTIIEMGKTLFPDKPRISNFGQEYKIIKEYAESLPGVIVYKSEEMKNIVEGKYEPPSTILQTIKRVNAYIANTGLETEAKLSPKEKKCMNALMGYLHNYRFLHQINTYEKLTDRQLFEDAFIKHTWDAHDLQSQDVEQFLVLATEVVISHSILARMEMLKKLVDETIANDEDTRKFSMSLIEAINVAQTEYNSSVKRQRDLHDALTKKRSLRLGDQVKENASLVGLIQFWQNHDKRKQMVELAEMRKNTIKEEIDRLRNMDELKLQIWGIHPDEILNS